MAAFNVLYRTTQVSPDHFEARVFVVPVEAREGGLATRSECRIFSDAETAAAECQRMVTAMQNRLLRWGHEVVVIHDPRPAETQRDMRASY